MYNKTMPIEIVRERIFVDHLKQVADQTFGDMVKVVVDVERNLMAIGGELHADEEAVLLQEGSQQSDPWGANIYPNRSVGQQIEFSSLINIRPSQGNRSQEIENVNTKQKVREAIERLTGLS